MNYNDYFQKAKEKNITNIQIVEKTIIDSSVEILDGKIESYDDYNNIDYNVKAEYNGKTVKLDADYLDEDSLDLIIMKCNITDTNYKDDYIEKNKSISKKKPLEFNIKDEINELLKLDKLKEKYPDIKKLTIYFSENYTNTRIINSKNVDISTDSHLCSLIVEAITENNGQFISYDEKKLFTNKSDINFKEFAESVIEKTLILKKQRKLESKKYNIILGRKVASRIVGSFGQMLSASAIRNKVSCLENKKGKQLFSNKLTIIEDPTNKKYPGYRLFDDEGTETYKKYIIKNGKIETYLYNIKEAIIAKTKSTGNGYSQISTRNMYMVPGKLSEEQLIKELNDGIYIVDYMESGGTSINSVNGDISLQVFGFIIENGKLICGIEPSILTTTIYELLSNIEEIGNDLTFTNTSHASPSLYIKNISIAR